VRARTLAVSKAALVALLMSMTATLWPAAATPVAEAASASPAGFDRLEIVADADAVPHGARVVDGASLAGIACDAPSAGCAHPGFARLGRAAATDDGVVVAFVGDRGKGPAVFASIDDGRGSRVLQLVAGEHWDRAAGACRAPELGVGAKPASVPLCFAALDLDSRVATSSVPLGWPGADGDSLTVAFWGKPSAASRDDFKTTVPFTGEPGLWTVALDSVLLEDDAAPAGDDDGLCDGEETCRWRYRRAPARRIVQVGQSVAGRSIAGLAVEQLQAAGTPGAPTTARPRAGEYHLVARASMGDGREILLRASHVEQWTSSYYMRTVDHATAGGLGCALAPRLAGSEDEEALLVLDFARPREWTGPNGETVYGASIWNGAGRYPDTVQIASAVQAFVDGYAECAPAGARTPRLTVVVGTTNHGDQVTQGHGRAWAEMVNGIADWIEHRGLSGWVEVAGGSDMELAYNSPTVTRAWVDGYRAVGEWPLYNFGDAAACPQKGTTAVPGRCDHGWTQEDIWYISAGSPLARVLPEIYSTGGGNAATWQQLVLYSALAHPDRPLMRIEGVLTQRQAVEQVCGGPPFKGACRGMENTPEQGWAQMSQRLASDPRTAPAGVRIRSTDIRWCYPGRCAPE
jgi:hypothetical protein